MVKHSLPRSLPRVTNPSTLFISFSDFFSFKHFNASQFQLPIADLCSLMQLYSILLALWWCKFFKLHGPSIVNFSCNKSWHFVVACVCYDACVIVTSPSNHWSLTLLLLVILSYFKIKTIEPKWFRSCSWRLSRSKGCLNCYRSCSFVHRMDENDSMIARWVLCIWREIQNIISFHTYIRTHHSRLVYIRYIVWIKAPIIYTSKFLRRLYVLKPYLIKWMWRTRWSFNLWGMLHRIIGVTKIKWELITTW
jgi:hypothetical protein